MDNEHAPDTFSVLLIDDDQNFRALMKVLIESTGCNTLEARSGKDADQLLREHHPNLVIVDYRLPGIDGMQWIEKFREAGWTTPIIFLSGSWCDLQSFTRLRSLLKVNLILQKPIVPELFLDQIESLLPRRYENQEDNLIEESFQRPSASVYKFEILESDKSGASSTSGDLTYSKSANTATLGAATAATTATPAEGDDERVDSPDLADSSSTSSSSSTSKAPLPAEIITPAAGQTQQVQSGDDISPQTERSTQTGSSAYAHSQKFERGAVKIDADSNDPLLRKLFENDAHSNDSSSQKSSTPAPRTAAQSKDLMRRSSTRMEAFKPSETITQGAHKGESLPETFESVPLSKDDPNEMAIIKSEEPDVLEQLHRFSQKASVEMALRNARADYARLLPDKTEELSEIVAKLKENTSDAALFDEALQIAHQLKGTAGSLGFPHLGRIAAIVETMLLAGGIGDTTAGKEKWKKLERQVEQCVSVARANAIAYARPERVARPAFMKRVALVGNSPHFASLTLELAKENTAEAYLVDNVEALLSEENGDRFNCVVVDSAALDAQSPTELLEQARDSKKLRNAPFAFIAADSWQADEALWLYTGAEFLLPETVTAPALMNVVESMLILNDVDKPRVLTVDDDAVLTGFICDTLSANGIATSALNEPINVLSSLEKYRPDLLLLDVVMPGVSGYDVCRMLRADAKFAELPILFLTSKSSPEGRAAAFKAGADDFLSKPILTEELIARVRSRLELSKPFRDRAGTNNQTGLTTRQAFLEALTGSLAQSSVAGNVFSIVVVAIDKFEELAISVGFKKQEEMFKDLAQLLQDRFRVEDLKGHWSDGSFALAFPNVESNVINQAMTFLAGEFAVGTTHNTSGSGTTAYRLLRYGLAELLVDGVSADTLLSHAYERCLHSVPIDVSGFIELCQDESS
jgi:DNA-binding response OmpR family regulator/HPt (histidine-containing phosphotransfer) domain-containing protein